MKSDAQIYQDLLVKTMSQAREGFTLVDAQQPNFPLVYVNKGFESLTGYAADEVLGKNYHFLQGTDIAQPDVAAMFSTMARGEHCVASLRNYRKDGSIYLSELNITPLHDAQGTLTHFVGILSETTAKNQAGQPAQKATYTHPLIDIGNRHLFEERFSDLLNFAQRIRDGISVLMIDLDNFKHFNEGYGRAAGDECLRRVGECIAKSTLRSSDCVARYGGEEFVIVSFSTSIEALRNHALRLGEQVRALSIPYADSPLGVVTISIGGIHRMPNRETTTAQLMELANQELLAAKRSGRNQVNIIG